MRGYRCTYCCCGGSLWSRGCQTLRKLAKIIPMPTQIASAQAEQAKPPCPANRLPSLGNRPFSTASAEERTRFAAFGLKFAKADISLMLAGCGGKTRPYFFERRPVFKNVEAGRLYLLLIASFYPAAVFKASISNAQSSGRKNCTSRSADSATTCIGSVMLCKTSNNSRSRRPGATQNRALVGTSLRL